MNKSDLKNGMVVTLESGDRFVVYEERLVGNIGYMRIEGYNEDMTHRCDGYDIVKVQLIGNSFGCGFNGILNGKIYKEGVFETIWERKKEREIDWSKVPKFTRVYVGDNNKDCIPRYFIGIEDGKHKYKVTQRGEFTYDEYYSCSYKYCKIADESEIKEEWYK